MEQELNQVEENDNFLEFYRSKIRATKRRDLLESSQRLKNILSCVIEKYGENSEELRFAMVAVNPIVSSISDELRKFETA